MTEFRWECHYRLGVDLDLAIQEARPDSDAVGRFGKVTSLREILAHHDQARHLHCVGITCPPAWCQRIPELRSCSVICSMICVVHAASTTRDPSDSQRGPTWTKLMRCRLRQKHRSPPSPLSAECQSLRCNGARWQRMATLGRPPEPEGAGPFRESNRVRAQMSFGSLAIFAPGRVATPFA